MKINDKRLGQLRESWIKNVIKFQGISRDEAENLYRKIKPFNDDGITTEINKLGKTVLKKDGVIIGEQG